MEFQNPQALGYDLVLFVCSCVCLLVFQEIKEHVS